MAGKGTPASNGNQFAAAAGIRVREAFGTSYEMIEKQRNIKKRGK